MARFTFEQTKSRVNVGMIGDVDHGKTTLTAAITKVLSLRGATQAGTAEQPEEPAEAAGRDAHPLRLVEYETASRRYTHVDYLSQADYIKHIITGAVKLDGTLLVVSVLKGIMPVTRAQLLLAQRAQVPALVVFLNKVDLVNDRALLELVERELREQLSRLGFPGETVSVVRGSAQAALDSSSRDPAAPEYRPIWSLLEAMDTTIPTSLPAAEQPFLMNIENILKPHGPGMLVTGRVERGRIRPGDTVDVIGIHQPVPRRAFVIRLEDSQRPVEQGSPGDAVQCLIRPFQPVEVRRGHMLAQPGSLRPSARFTAAVQMLDQDQGGPRQRIFSGYQPQFTFGQADVVGRVLLPDRTDVVLPGDSAQVDVRLGAVVPLEAGQRFAIHEGRQIIGAGVVTTIDELALDPQTSLESKGVDTPPVSFTLGDEQDPTHPVAPAAEPYLKTVNAWIGGRGEQPPERLVVGQLYTLSFNVGEAVGHSLLDTPDARIPDTDIPAKGLSTTWQIMSRTVALEPVSDEVAVTTKRSSNVTIWEAKFELHIPRVGESATVSLALSPRHAGEAQLDVIIQARGELYRHLEIDLSVGAEPGGVATPPAANSPTTQAATPVSVRDSAVFGRADQLGLPPLCPWQQPPGSLEIFITSQGLARVTGDVFVDGRAEAADHDMLWMCTHASVAGQILSLRIAAEDFRKTSDRYLNAIDPEDLLSRLAAFVPSVSWFPPSSTADQAHQQTWEQVRQSAELRELALQGRNLYETLFQNQELRMWLEQLKPGHRIDLRWTTPAAISGLPWGLLYMGDLDQPIDPFGFWGLRFRIHYTAHTTTRLFSKYLGRPEQTFRGHWMYWGGDSSDQTAAEARWQRNLWAGKPGSVFAPQDPASPQPAQELRSLLKAKPGKMPVLYFFCQCVSDQSKNKLVLRFDNTNKKETALTVSDFPQSDMSDRPLVFINACTTAAADPYIANDLEEFLFRKGCSAFLGTETKVPIQFASRFAQIFFHFFYRQADSAGTPVAAGEAVAQTRLFLWTNYCNIGGILYSYVNQYELFMADEAEIAAPRV